MHPKDTINIKSIRELPTCHFSIYQLWTLLRAQGVHYMRYGIETSQKLSDTLVHPGITAGTSKPMPIIIWLSGKCMNPCMDSIDKDQPQNPTSWKTLKSLTLQLSQPICLLWRCLCFGHVPSSLCMVPRLTSREYLPVQQFFPARQWQINAMPFIVGYLGTSGCSIFRQGVAKLLLGLLGNGQEQYTSRSRDCWPNRVIGIFTIFRSTENLRLEEIRPLVDNECHSRLVIPLILLPQPHMLVPGP